MEACLFCGIVAGDVPAQIVDSDERTAAVIQLFEAADDMSAAEGAFDAMDPGGYAWDAHLGQPLRDQGGAELARDIRHAVLEAARLSDSAMSRENVDIVRAGSRRGTGAT
jgi:hypothetical protein